MFKKPVRYFYFGNDPFTKKQVLIEDDFVSSVLCVGGMGSGSTTSVTKMAAVFLLQPNSNLIVADPLKYGLDFKNLLKEEVLDSFEKLAQKIRALQLDHENRSKSILKAIINELTRNQPRTLFVLESFESIAKNMKDDPEFNSLVSWLIQCGPFYGIKVIAIYHSSTDLQVPFLSSRIYNLFRQTMIFRTTNSISHFIFEDERASDMGFLSRGEAFTLGRKVEFHDGRVEALKKAIMDADPAIGVIIKDEE